MMKPPDQKTAADLADETPRASGRMRARGETARDKADVKRSPSETTTLVCAVSLAVALGVACGAWINARLASAASTPSVAVNRLRPAERAAVQNNAPAPSAVVEATPGEGRDAPAAADEAPSPPAADEAPPSDEPSEAARPRTDNAGSADQVSHTRRVGAAASEAETKPAARAFGTRGGAAEVEKKQGGAREAGKRATAGHGRVAPCALYASANSLTVRGGGGAATLILGGPGDAGRVTVATPNWSDIAVFSEGRVGDKGWVRYSVRSISKRAGVYTVRFTTPCGSHTIPVTVTRP